MRKTQVQESRPAPTAFRGRRRGDRRFTASAADEEAAEAAHAGEDSWSVMLCLWLLNPAVVFQQLSSKV